MTEHDGPKNGTCIGDRADLDLRVNPLYVNHFWPSHLQDLMQFLIFVCLDMDVNYANYQLINFNGL